jgi:hypothetical protein
VYSFHLLIAHLAELYRTQREFMSATMFFSTALPPEVFNNLTGLPRVDYFSYYARLAHIFQISAKFRSDFVHWYSETAVLCQTLLA